MLARSTVAAALCVAAMAAVPAVTHAAAPARSERPPDLRAPGVSPWAEVPTWSASERRRGASPAPVWINRGQTEPIGSALDVVENGSVVVAPGCVGSLSETNFTLCRWFVRGIDADSGATLWEDRFGPGIFDLAKEADIDGPRAFVAGWVLRPGPGFGFVVRAYDTASGDLLWAQEIGLGPSCLPESPGFARCVAKDVLVHDGRVFVAGHLTRTANRSDFAVLAFDEASGAPLWESVTDPTDTGADDFAWALAAEGQRLYVVGEVGDFTGMQVQAHDVRTGAIEWRRQVPGATNFGLPETVTVAENRVAITGGDAAGHFFVRAFDGRTGAPAWSDVVDDAGQVGLGSALATDGDAIFAGGLSGCDPATFLDCELVVRAYDPRTGLLWQRADSARGGDWNFTHNLALGRGRLHVGAEELLDDGLYHGTIKSYGSDRGQLVAAVPFDDGSGNPNGFIQGLATTPHAVVSAGNNGTEDGFDFIVRSDRQP